MRTIVRAQPPRRPASTTRGNESRTEAATELVRLEYERERLTLGVEQARNRLATTLEALMTVDRRIQWLMERNDLLKQPGSFAIARAGNRREKNG